MDGMCVIMYHKYATMQELGMQVFRVAQDLLNDADKKLLVQHAIGGANPKRQHEAIRRHKPALVVGTPGRILELIDSGAIHAQHCPLLILDEARINISRKLGRFPFFSWLNFCTTDCR